MKTKFLLKTLLASLVFSGIIFLAAGKINYSQGWIFLVTSLITSVMNYWAIRNNESLMNERSSIGEGTKTWDKLILGISSIVYLLNIIVAGLDSGRFQWSPPFHWSVYVLGVFLMIAGNIIFLNARKENAYFSSVVRIQSDRGHKVCNTGSYQLVRHPGYLGMIISLTGVPMITGSLWSIIPTSIAILLLIIRTYLEDKTLKNELDGYTDYTLKTTKRLVPKIW